LNSHPKIVPEANVSIVAGAFTAVRIVSVSSTYSLEGSFGSEIRVAGCQVREI
jgi:hypothetical protein